MSTLALAIMMVVLVVIAFLLGFAFCMMGIAQKVNSLEKSNHHNGMKWIKFIDYIK